MKRWLLSLLMLFICISANAAYAETYKVDIEHSSVSFKIRHLLGYVKGEFADFQGTIKYDPSKPEQSSTNGTIEAASIDTGVKERDKHLRSADFFDVAKYPQIKFNSVKVKEVTPGGGKLEGVITIHGVEKPIVLDVEIHGVAKDPWGNERAAFTATTKLNRKDFGLNWNQALETGGFLVGDEVMITIEAEGIKA